ncbi:hypothetical protein MKX03_015438 [Papaver bracteatum]|nr:hypothetical protein MKX03_015438 [Papaver bracteatum]
MCYLTRPGKDRSLGYKVKKLLNDAFFKYETKPKLTTHGELYHEGEVLETIGCTNHGNGSR